MAITFIDTHAHLYLPEFDTDRDTIVSNAIQAGVRKILLPNIDERSVDIMNKMCSDYPDVCFPMMGLHPTSVKADFAHQISVVESELKNGGYFGVGEIGIDLYWDTSHLKEQEEAFRTQIDLSLRYDLAVAVHARNSFNEILSILSDYRNKGVKGVFHAFTGNEEIAKQVIEMGFHIGVGGILTYKNTNLPGVISKIPIERIVLETDSPWLAPVPHRGKRNESSYIPVIAQVIQKIKNISLKEVADVTTLNAINLFRLHA